MCSDYRLIERVPAETLFPHVLYPEGIPNFEPRQDIRITDRAPILRAATKQAGAVELDGRRRPALPAIELVQRRWSWPGPGGKPVYNFRSEGRDLPPHRRCIILADGFYEFTAHSDPKAKRKHKWLFTLKDRPWFGIAGLWRQDAAVGEAFTMLTCPPHEDVAPYHDRGIVVLAGDDMARWLDPAVPSREMLKPLPAGSLAVEQVA
jgi:putative SOS response-associated peptidase YedK